MLSAWILALLATTGSLFFSLVMDLPPCDLCWYQRIAIYPLVIILGIGIVKKDKTSLRYAWPLAVIGWIIAIYHNLIYYGFIPEIIASCKSGVSCTDQAMTLFGFVSIPLLSLVAFTLILIFLYFARRESVIDKSLS